MTNIGPDLGPKLRAEGVRDLTAEEMAGSRGADGRGVVLPTSPIGNPGPTTDRGVEANTAKTSPANSYTLILPPDSFSAMGERYPGDPDGES